MLTIEKILQENPDFRIPGYESVKTPLDAATVILHYFESERERKDFLSYPNMLRGSENTSRQLHNDGRSIGQIAGLFQYKKDLAWAGLDIVMNSIEDPKALTLEDAAYLLAVAFPGYKGQGASSAKTFLAVAEKLMDSGTLPKLDPVGLDARRLPLDAMFVQTTSLFLYEHLNDRFLANKDDELMARSIDLAQRFLKYFPQDDNYALFLLDRNADEAQVYAAAPDIQKAWLNSVVGMVNRAFPDGINLTPRYEWLRERYQAATTRDDFIIAALGDKKALNEHFPRIAPGKGLVPAVEYKPSVA